MMKDCNVESRWKLLNGDRRVGWCTVMAEDSFLSKVVASLDMHAAYQE